MIYLITLLFAFACGRHDVPAVDNFTYYGSNVKHQKAFHRWNFILKTCYVLAVSFIDFRYHGDLWAAVELGVCNTLIIWAVFDPVVALWRTPKKDWYYLSTGNITDRFLLLFGGKAGMVKFFACLAVVIVLLVT